jgi:hypothetical protein
LLAWTGPKRLSMLMSSMAGVIGVAQNSQHILRGLCFQHKHLSMRRKGNASP